MGKIQEVPTIGVIIGRFQVDELTDGHKILIDAVAKEHADVYIILGLSPCKCTKRNPLDFAARKAMINKSYPNVKVLYIQDVRSDVLWSDRLDSLVNESVGSPESVVLYGGRDSFIKSYCGKYKSIELIPQALTSGSERRKALYATIQKNSDFRKGVIWATGNKYDSCMPTIDAAIFNNDKSRILLGRKTEEHLYRFIGGFVEPGETLEAAVIKEVREETGIRVRDLQYIKSFLIDDWRYRAEDDKITTALFVINEWDGTIEAGDDIAEVRWFPFNDGVIDNVVMEHREMMAHLLS